VFVGVPKDSIPLFTDSFRHLDIDAISNDSEFFCIKIKTECELLDSIPEFDYERLSVGEISVEENEDYARLLRDEETNKFWGYDFRDDFGEAVADSFFRENAIEEFERGTALTLALRNEGCFIGEGTLYAFDGKGEAELAIRLLPEARGKGFGREGFLALAECARRIGLVRIVAFVDKRNEISLKYLGKLMKTEFQDVERVKFSYELF